MKDGCPERKIEVCVGKRLSIGEGGCRIEVVVIIAIAKSLAQDVEVHEHDKEETSHEKGIACGYLVIDEHVEQHA